MGEDNQNAMGIIDMGNYDLFYFITSNFSKLYNIL